MKSTLYKKSFLCYATSVFNIFAKYFKVIMVKYWLKSLKIIKKFQL